MESVFIDDSSLGQLILGVAFKFYTTAGLRYAELLIQPRQIVKDTPNYSDSNVRNDIGGSESYCCDSVPFILSLSLVIWALEQALITDHAF